MIKTYKVNLKMWRKITKYKRKSHEWRLNVIWINKKQYCVKFGEFDLRDFPKFELIIEINFDLSEFTK